MMDYDERWAEIEKEWGRPPTDLERIIVDNMHEWWVMKLADYEDKASKAFVAGDEDWVKFCRGENGGNCGG